MTELFWRKIKVFKLEMKPGALWRIAVDFVPGPRLLRFQVLDKDEQGNAVVTEWGRKPPVLNGLCKADGTPVNPPKGALLCATAPYGALIGKLGGSSADQPDSAQTSAPYGSRKVFAIGSYCVLALTRDDSGPLFLTRNETLDSFGDDLGELLVQIEEATT